MNINFIGVGAIGLPMANQIIKAGYSVVGIDPSIDAQRIAKESGLSVVSSYDNLNKANVVVVMVATPDQLKKLVDDVADRVANQTWIIMSTVGPDAIKEQGDKLRLSGAKVIDAPVTGGTARAKTGKLVIFTAGHLDDIKQIEPILSTMGQIRIVGEKLGDGQSIKVVNQHLCSVHIVAAAEALNLAESLGLDKSKVLDLVKGGAAGSWMLSDRGPRMLLGNDAPVTSTINIFVKDSSLVALSAKSSGAKVPLLEIANMRYKSAAEAGLGLRDDSRVIETYKKN